MKRNTAGQHVSAQLTSATDGSAITAGASVSVSGDGGAFAAGTGTLAHKSGGSWDYIPAQAETNYDHIAFLFSATGAISVTVQADTGFPQTGDVFGALPANFSTFAVDGSGRVDVGKIGGTAQTARDIGASVLLSSGTGTGQVSLSSGAVTVGTNNDKTGYSLSAAAIQAIWDALTSALTTVGSIGKLLATNIDAAISSRLASGSYTAPDNTSVAAIKAKTDSLTFTVANVVDSNIVDWKGSVAPANTGDAFARLGAPAGASVSADIAAVKSDLDAGVTLATSSRPGIRKNVALAHFEFPMTDSTNHAPAAGLTVSVTRSIDGGAFAAGTLSAVTEIGNGIYAVDFAAADLNGGVVTLRATATGADDSLVTIHTDP